MEQKYQETVENLEISSDKISDLNSKVEELTQLNEWEHSKQEEDKIKSIKLLKEKETVIEDWKLKCSDLESQLLNISQFQDHEDLEPLQDEIIKLQK